VREGARGRIARQAVPRFYKWVWRAFLAALNVASFFGAPIPKTASVSVDWLTSVDIWIINHAAYPSIFALSVGLIFGTVLIPEAWAHFQRQTSESTPDTSARAAFQRLCIDSKWAVGRGVDDGKLLVEAQREFRDAARLGRIQTWGRRKTGISSVISSALEIIPSEYWANALPDLTTCFSNRSAAPSSFPMKRDAPEYYDLQVNRREANTCWPNAWWIIRRLDKHWQERREGPNEGRENWTRTSNTDAPIRAAFSPAGLDDDVPPLEIVFDPENPGQKFWSIESPKAESGARKPGAFWEYRVLIRNTSATKTLRNVRPIVEATGAMPTRPEYAPFDISYAPFDISKEPAMDLAPGAERLVVIRRWWYPAVQAGMVIGESVYGPLKITVNADDTLPVIRVFKFDYRRTPMIYD